MIPDVTPALVSVAFIPACKEAGVEDFSGGGYDTNHGTKSTLSADVPSYLIENRGAAGVDLG